MKGVRVKPRLPRRKIASVQQNNPTVMKAVVDDAACVFVRQHPQYEYIIAYLREGVPVSEVARWAKENGHLDGVSEKTFAVYLRTFRAKNVGTIKTHDGVVRESIDTLVDNGPVVDTVQELSRLYRLQKIRIQVDVKTELNMGKLFNTTRHEIAESRELLATIATIQGKMGGAVQTGHSHSVDVRDSLNALREDEEKRDRIAGLLGALVTTVSPDKETVDAS